MLWITPPSPSLQPARARARALRVRTPGLTGECLRVMVSWSHSSRYIAFHVSFLCADSFNIVLLVFFLVYNTCDLALCMQLRAFAVSRWRRRYECRAFAFLSQDKTFVLVFFCLEGSVVRQWMERLSDESKATKKKDRGSCFCGTSCDVLEWFMLI